MKEQDINVKLVIRKHGDFLFIPKLDLSFQIENDRIYKFKYSIKEMEEDEMLDNPKIKDVFEKEEITLNEFVKIIKENKYNKKEDMRKEFRHELELHLKYLIEELVKQ